MNSMLTNLFTSILQNRTKWDRNNDRVISKLKSAFSVNLYNFWNTTPRTFTNMQL